MSSFFGDLTGGGISMPNTVFDQSSMLPPLNTAGYGAGYDGTPDARINAGSSLFSDMQPYAYGEGDRLTTQTAYLANPHNIQKIVPQLILPDGLRSHSPCNFSMPHAVSDGDVAFSIRFKGTDVRKNLMKGSNDFFRKGAGKAVDYICNIATINYIMRGIFTLEEHLNPAWSHFACAMGFENEYTNIQTMISGVKTEQETHGAEQTVEFAQLRDTCNKRLQYYAEQLVRDHFRPLGVVIGSDKQGGQHEGGNKSVTFPVAYIVTISIDGKNENLCNFWRHVDISSGSDLGFYVRNKKNCNTYTLNHHKQTTRKIFGAVHGESVLSYPQLCPDTVDHSTKEPQTIEGHWHFCMPQMMHHKITDTQTYNDISTFHTGALLQSTISVAWIRKNKKPSKTPAIDSDRNPENYESGLFNGRVKAKATKDGTGSFKTPFNALPLYLMSSSNPQKQALLQRVAMHDVDTPTQFSGIKRPSRIGMDTEGFDAHFKMQRRDEASNLGNRATDPSDGGPGMLSPRTEKKLPFKKKGGGSVRVSETTESVGIGAPKKTPVV